MKKTEADRQLASTRGRILSRLRADAAEIAMQSYCARCGWLTGYGCACDTGPEIVVLNRPTPLTPDGSAVERIARTLEPVAWAELDAGEGSWVDEAGCRQSLAAAERLVQAFPALLGLIT